MADFAASQHDVSFLSGPMHPAPASAHLGTEVSTTLYYLMRGYRTLTSDYETWVATGSPNSNNPSGQPITNITIQLQWSS